MSCFYVKCNTVEKMYNSLICAPQNPGPYESWLQVTESPEKRRISVCLVLDIRRGVGTSEMLCHVLSLVFSFILPACCFCTFLVNWL